MNMSMSTLEQIETCGAYPHGGQRCKRISPKCGVRACAFAREESRGAGTEQARKVCHIGDRQSYLRYAAIKSV